MKRMTPILAIVLVVYVASSVALAFATSDVRPPGAGPGVPIPTETEWSRNEIAAWVQAVGSVAAIFIAIGAVLLSHWLDVRRSEKAIRREEARTLETVASIVINAMNLIDTAKKNICDNGSRALLGYCLKVYDPAAFKIAAEALREIQIAHLPDYEVVKPVLEMRGLILEADAMIEQIHRTCVIGEADLDEGLKSFEKLHRRANLQTSTVEEAVRRVRD